MKNKYTTIMLSTETHARLRAKGVFGDNFDKVINRLINTVDSSTKQIVDKNAENLIRKEIKKK